MCVVGLLSCLVLSVACRAVTESRYIELAVKAVDWNDRNPDLPACYALMFNLLVWLC